MAKVRIVQSRLGPVAVHIERNKYAPGGRGVRLVASHQQQPQVLKRGEQQSRVSDRPAIMSEQQG